MTVLDLERLRAEIAAGYFGPDRAAALARIDALLAERAEPAPDVGDGNGGARSGVHQATGPAPSE